MGRAVTCGDVGREVSGLGKHPSVVLVCSRGFPSSCVLNAFHKGRLPGMTVFPQQRHGERQQQSD